jgi:hypothetical protein
LSFALVIELGMYGSHSECLSRSILIFQLEISPFFAEFSRDEHIFLRRNSTPDGPDLIKNYIVPPFIFIESARTIFSGFRIVSPSNSYNPRDHLNNIGHHSNALSSSSCKMKILKFRTTIASRILRLLFF